MATRQVHLDKGPKGMASRTACGRNILRTPMSADWAGFLEERPENRCAKCAASKQVEVNSRADAKRVIYGNNPTSANELAAAKRVLNIN